jgi:hypothetical protein
MLTTTRATSFSARAVTIGRMRRPRTISRRREIPLIRDPSGTTTLKMPERPQWCWEMRSPITERKTSSTSRELPLLLQTVAANDLNYLHTHNNLQS